MFSGPDSDKLAIRELIDRYSDAVNLRDADAWSATWADDGSWHFHGQQRQGRDAILATWTAAMAGFRQVWFMAYPGAIEIDGDLAHVRTHTFEHLVPNDGPPRLQSGLYADIVIRTATGWQFQERKFSSQEISL